MTHSCNIKIYSLKSKSVFEKWNIKQANPALCKIQHNIIEMKYIKEQTTSAHYTYYLKQAYLDLQ